MSKASEGTTLLQSPAIIRGFFPDFPRVDVAAARARMTLKLMPQLAKGFYGLAGRFAKTWAVYVDELVLKIYAAWRPGVYRRKPPAGWDPSSSLHADLHKFINQAQPASYQSAGHLCHAAEIAEQNQTKIRAERREQALRSGAGKVMGRPHFVRRDAMRKLTKEESRRFRKRLLKSERKHQQVKRQLFKAAEKASNHGKMPRYLWPDVNMEAWVHRNSGISDFLEQRGFSREVVTLALTDADWETKETVAQWLREQLQLLRAAERRGDAPTRRGKALPRIKIADVAIELISCISDGLGETMICLLQELLDVDRHRKDLAYDYSRVELATDAEAQWRLQGYSCGVNVFAKLMSVAPSTVTRWRRTPSYKASVQRHMRTWSNTLRDDYFEKITADAPQATETECFRRAFQMYELTIEQRRAGKFPMK